MLDLSERFWSKVDKSGDCWLWTASKKRGGYGAVWDGTRIQAAHRVSWMLQVGPIPSGLHVLHQCDNPCCVRPSHLFLGTNNDNVQDCLTKGRNRTGEMHPSAKLTGVQVAEIRFKYADSGIFQRSLANDYGVCQQTISDIINGKYWMHGSRPGVHHQQWIGKEIR